MKQGNIRVVVSGSAWMGGGLASIETALYQLLTGANDQILIIGYTISTAAPLLFQQLIAALQRGVRVSILLNRFSLQPLPVRRQLELLWQHSSHLFQVHTFTPVNEEADLHAKIVLVDRYSALIGSANLSQRGLMNNHELAVVIEGTGVAEVVKATDLLLVSPLVSPVHF